MAVRGDPSGRDAGDAVEAESLDLTVGDLRLAARRLRPANSLSEPVFVFLHEALGSIGQWKAFPERLAGACGLPGLIYERRGHGGSAPLDLPRENGYLRHEARQVLPAVLAAADVRRPVLVGHSDGATIALMFAAAFPEAVSACIVLAPHVMVEEITLTGIRAADAEPGATALRARLDPEAWPRPPIFGFLQKHGELPESEMRRVFNCGIGLVVVVHRDEADDVAQRLEAMGERAYRIGAIEAKEADEPALEFVPGSETAGDGSAAD